MAQVIRFVFITFRMPSSFSLITDSKRFLGTGVSLLVRNGVNNHPRPGLNFAKTSTRLGTGSQKEDERASDEFEKSKAFHLSEVLSSSNGQKCRSAVYREMCTSECLEKSSSILHQLEEAQEAFNHQKWDAAHSKYNELPYHIKETHEIQGNMAVCLFQANQVVLARMCASLAATLHPGQMAYHELVVQGYIKEGSYEEALNACNEGLAIDSNILDGDSSDKEELMKLKQYCIANMIEELEESLSRLKQFCIGKTYGKLDHAHFTTDDYPFRQFLRGFISQDALKKIAANVATRGNASAWH